MEQSKPGIYAYLEREEGIRKTLLSALVEFNSVTYQSNGAHGLCIYAHPQNWKWIIVSDGVRQDYWHYLISIEEAKQRIRLWYGGILENQLVAKAYRRKFGRRVWIGRSE